MFSLTELPSSSSLFAAYASLTGSMMIARSMLNQLIPHQLQSLLLSKLQFLYNPLSSQFTLVIEEYDGFTCNEVYDAAEIFLSTKITPSVRRLRVMKDPKGKDVTYKMDKGEEFVDNYQGAELKWEFVFDEKEQSNPEDSGEPQQKTTVRFFELRFHKKHKDKVLASYLPYVLDRAKALKEENKVVKLHTLGSYSGEPWESINLDHPATFHTLAMDQKLKTDIIEDLERFVKRRDFYRRVGKAWKRGYLLYGPPGTGKSSLIAAMANYLKFDVYDLDLTKVTDNSDLRRLLVTTANRSILVIEDIDCSVDLPNRRDTNKGVGNDKLTLSGLLNFIDGLWSSCGDERIIIFTTNHKDRLDPALLRPGRMDKHINLSYCTIDGFNTLASNYLGIHCNNKSKLYQEIEDSIEKSQVTPAEVAEELMKSEDSDTALGGLHEFLKRKRPDQDEPNKNVDECQKPKRVKGKNEVVKRVTRSRGRKGPKYK